MISDPNVLAGRFTSMGIAQFDDLGNWGPQVGDFIIYNGLLKHWFGVVMGISAGEIQIVKAVLPVDVITMGPNKTKKKTVPFDIIDIQKARGGKYAVIQCIGGQLPVVYVG